MKQDKVRRNAACADDVETAAERGSPAQEVGKAAIHAIPHRATSAKSSLLIERGGARTLTRCGLPTERAIGFG